jgi:uridine kinase
MKNAFVVGIAGGTASGKSTFCGNLKESLCELKLKIKLLHMDDYFKPENERPFLEAFVSGKKYIDDNNPLTMYLDRLKADIEANLKQAEYDVIIIEGLLTLWDNDIFKKLDLKLFIDCKADERIVRRIKRNMEWGLTFDEITNVYLDMVRYRHDEYVEPSKWRADMILNGSNSPETALSVIKEYIYNRCREKRAQI